MPLPRFDRLDDERRDAILGAAASEFSEHGFERSSYNRIIAAAGISKGAMYYYFADKDDLYRTVLREAIARWITNVGSPSIAKTASEFWDEAEQVYARSIRLMMDDPMTAALCLSATRARQRLEGHPALIELNAHATSWTRALIAHGQMLGAIRKDLPPDLMLHIGLSMMDAGDRWLADRWDEIERDDVDRIAKQMVKLLRRVGETPDE